MVELMSPPEMCPEETSQSQGPRGVRKQTQPDLWKKSVLETMSWGHALSACQGKTYMLQTQWAWAKPVLPADTSLQKTHLGSHWSEEHSTCCSAREQSRCHSKWLSQ